MLSSIQVDPELLTLVRCPFCQQGFAVDHGEPYFCGTCDGSAFVLYPASLIAEYKERAA